MTKPFELTCKEIVELVTDYLEGRMAPPQRSLFEQHIVMCQPCATYLEQMRTMIGLAATLDASLDVDAVPEPPSAVLEAFRRLKRQDPP